MKGLYLRSNSSRFPERPSSFAVWFAPILPRLAEYYWDYVFIEIPPDAPRETAASYLALYREVSQLPYIPPDTSLPRFADYVFDGGWHRFCGCLHHPTSARLTSRRTLFDAEKPSAVIDIVFCCIDGGPLWTIHARDESILTPVSQHAVQLPGAMVEEAAQF